MANVVRYEKTRKGFDEIRRRRDLAGKVRIMLILVDPSKTAEQLLDYFSRQSYGFGRLLGHT